MHIQLTLEYDREWKNMLKRDIANWSKPMQSNFELLMTKKDLKDVLITPKHFDLANTDYPEEYKKLKAQLENKKYDVGSDERIYLAAMEATEFCARIYDEEHIERTPLLKKLSEIESQYDEED